MSVRKGYFQGNLRIIRKIGTGSFGDTYLVESERGERLVVKQAKQGGSAESDKQSRAEGNVSRLASDHVVKLHRTWTEPGSNRLCMLLEYCDGGDMEMLLEKAYPLPEQTVVAVFAQLLIGLDHIHMKHLLHRDVKLQNILLQSNDSTKRIPTAKIADFGTSKNVSHTDSPAATRLGTPLYLSPEILSGHRYTRKTDVWSLGVAFYKILCNQMPFDGADMVRLTNAVINHDPPHPCTANPSVTYSLRLGDVVLRMLDKSRSSRLSTRELLALPAFASVFASYPWKGPALHNCIGVFACCKCFAVNVRTAPSTAAESVGAVRYADQIYVQRRIVAAPSANGDETLWFRVVSPFTGFCIVGNGGDPLFQLFQVPATASEPSTATCSTVGRSRTHSQASSTSASPVGAFR